MGKKRALCDDQIGAYKTVALPTTTTTTTTKTTTTTTTISFICATISSYSIAKASPNHMDKETVSTLIYRVFSSMTSNVL